jgi:hypothetical protein
VYFNVIIKRGTLSKSLSAHNTSKKEEKGGEIIIKSSIFEHIRVYSLEWFLSCMNLNMIT